MGYVYSPRQIEAGEIPSSADVKAAVDIAEDKLWILHRDGYLLGAKIHGGIYNNSGEGLVGSDIDVLEVTTSVEANSYLSDIYRKIKREKKVPIESVPYPRENAEKGLHDIDPFFYDHLKYGKGVVIGDDPLKFISLDTSVPIYVILKKRLDSHLRRLSVWSSEINEKYDEEHCKLLECMIRWLFQDALDMLRYKLGYTPKDADGNIIGKEKICERYKKEFPNTDTIGLFSILRLRKSYRGMINNPPVNLKDYVSLLDEIDASLADAYSFITENDSVLSESIKRGELRWK